jgi:transaldolase
MSTQPVVQVIDPAAEQTPLAKMARTTPTDFWNDSCATEELAYAVARGATGATSNPPIVLEVLKKEKAHWNPRVPEFAKAHPRFTEVELTWGIVEEMAVRGAKVLEPVFEREKGLKGRLSLQTNPANYPDPARMVEQAVHFASLAPNMQVKLPATEAGIAAIEEATFRGININATVSFTVPQALAAGEAVERGLRRRDAAGLDTASMSPVITIMVGRLDDWMKVLVDRDNIALHPDAPNWAGVAAFKRSYQIFKERGLRARLLSAAYRHRLHWTEFVGADVVLTLPYAWQVRFNASGIDPVNRIDESVPAAMLDDLLMRIPDFRRAYEPDGLKPSEFEHYGAASRTLRSFIKAYHDLQGSIRDLVLPDPDIKVG